MSRASILAAALLVPALAQAGEAPAADDEWAHWHWIYQGIAHAQPFVAAGTEVKSLMVRVARMIPERPPASALIVEVRDLALGKTLVKGTISPKEVNKNLRWVQVPLAKGAAKLEKGQTYVVLLRSPDSLNDAPWIVAARDVAPNKGTVDLTKRELACVVLFRDGGDVRIGPAIGAPDSPPSGTRGGGGQPYTKSLVVELDKPLPEAANAPAPASAPPAPAPPKPAAQPAQPKK